MPDKKIEYVDFEIYLGTFNDNEFTWHRISKHKDFEQAYKEFKKYTNKQLQYTEEDLKKVWDTGRIDIELRYGNKLLNWVGIYSREVSLMEPEKDKDEKPITKKELESAEKGKPASKR